MKNAAEPNVETWVASTIKSVQAKAKAELARRGVFMWSIADKEVTTTHIQELCQGFVALGYTAGWDYAEYGGGYDLCVRVKH